MGHPEEDTNGVFGYDFEDKETRLQLELIDDLQKLGVEKYLHLPQLVVVGDQSTGKSSVLQAVTEIPFLISGKMCTRFAIKIILKRTLPNTPTEIDISIIPDTGESPQRKEALLAWHPKEFDKAASLNKQALEKIFRQAKEAIFGNTSKENGTIGGKATNRLSSSTLCITRCGPKETNFAIVDIPGLVRGNETNTEHQTAKDLVEKHLKNLRSIVVVVIDVVDLERQEIFQMLDNLPDEETRVIGVINKCDTKQKKSHEWVFDLIRNDPSHTRRYLKEGWYGLRNRQASEIGSSDCERDKLEEEFFAGDDWKSLDKEKLGRHQLKKALIKMRNRHITQSIPKLVSEIQNKLDICIARSDQLGDPRDSNQAQYTLINKIASKYSKMAEGALDGQYKNLSYDGLFARKIIRDNLDTFHANMVAKGLTKQFSTDTQDAKAIANLPEQEWAEKIMGIPTYAWIRETINRYRGKEDAGDVNPEVKNELWKQQTASWNEIATETLHKIEKTVDRVNAALFEEACPEKDLRMRLLNWLQDDSVKASEVARHELRRLVADERGAQLFTLHPAKIERQHWYRQARINAITKQCKIDRPQIGLPQAAEPPSNVNRVAADVIINTIIYGNPDLAGILDTHDSLAAYYFVALYRFVDNFAMQVIERHLLGPCSPLRLFTSEYVSRKLYGPENKAELENLASEDPLKAQERLDLDAEKASLQECMKRVQSFKIL